MKPMSVAEFEDDSFIPNTCKIYQNQVLYPISFFLTRSIVDILTYAESFVIKYLVFCSFVFFKPINIFAKILNRS